MQPRRVADRQMFGARGANFTSVVNGDGYDRPIAVVDMVEIVRGLAGKLRARTLSSDRIAGH